jgi:sodium-dependent dicarboxylate transporter 2/3/5
MAVAYACSLSMALPVSTPPNAMAFSAGILKTRDMVVPGLLVSITGLIVTWTLGLFIWKLAGL